MGRTPQDITDKELDVLHVLWEHGPLPIRRITDVLYPDSRSSYYATVQKLLERLEAKGYVARDRSGSVPHAYFTWTEGNPLKNMLGYLLFGEGDIAPIAHEVLREAEPDPWRRPIIHVA